METTAAAPARRQSDTEAGRLKGGLAMEVCSQTMFKCDGLPLPNRIVVVGTGVRKILSPILS
ncbi:MAG: hypothetical protein DI609_05305 [Corynebacterium urealyticum]|uniref:Uncharacterized protein n=1 Tax=Corynebacterium urealyticum TaxID=43771 RepID=A0A2W5B552_9CORY|nr:MAG: hypothetical protein DI609_05305 [Corynebacterium urealyticum]